jgi:SAM-dependent methyltransferase
MDAGQADSEGHAYTKMWPKTIRHALFTNHQVSFIVMQEHEIQAFWQAHPCGEHFVDGLRQDYEAFFQRYDAFRYRKEAHIPRCLDAIDFKGKRVLEIGLGQGADSEALIRRGAIWSGIDLTKESTDRVAMRLRLRRLPHEALVCGSALHLPFADSTFDIVFSHGVLHHIPEVGQAQAEIARVLRPGGELIAMLYARWSLNYVLAIGLVRRLGLLLCRAIGYDPGGIVGAHLVNARAQGLWRYLALRNFIHRNTDGPFNPYSKVYSLAEAKRDFSAFRIHRAHKEFMYAPPLPVTRLPFAPWLGWHLWLHMRPRR